MLAITKDDVDKSGGVLGAISFRSVEYLKSKFTPTKNLHYVSTHILRNVVHTDPHLDEYFAELLFRSSLAIDSRELDFVEEAIYSSSNDLVAMELWPQAVVFGIGSTISPGAKPLIIFDEHTAGKGRFSLSCAELVAKYVANNDLNVYPTSIRSLITEVNSIDAYGKAHPQNLSKIIKTLHSVKFLFSKGQTSKDDVKDSLTDSWKRALLDGMLTAVIYAIDEGEDLNSNPDDKKKLLIKSLNTYKENSLHKNHPNFEKAYNFIASTYGQQSAVFSTAVLRDSSNKEILDSNGQTIPQILILGKVIAACIRCWGEPITNLIMMHIWESEFQKQLNFTVLESEIQSVFGRSFDVDKRTSVGVFSKRTLRKIKLNRMRRNFNNQFETINDSWCNPVIIYISPTSGIFEPHKAALNYVNEHNSYCGFVLVEDSFTATKALFITEGIPKDKWISLKSMIAKIEKDSWYDPTTNPAKPAMFITNGTRAHQYVKKSGLDIDALESLIEKVFSQKNKP